MIRCFNKLPKDLNLNEGWRGGEYKNNTAESAAQLSVCEPWSNFRPIVLTVVVFRCHQFTARRFSTAGVRRRYFRAIPRGLQLAALTPFYEPQAYFIFLFLSEKNKIRINYKQICYSAVVKSSSLYLIFGFSFFQNIKF